MTPRSSQTSDEEYIRGTRHWRRTDVLTGREMCGCGYTPNKAGATKAIDIHLQEARAPRDGVEIEVIRDGGGNIMRVKETDLKEAEKAAAGYPPDMTVNQARTAAGLPPAYPEKSILRRIVQLEITDQLTTKQLQLFVDAIPSTGADIKTIIQHSAGDRPGETDKTRIVLEARW